jgi:predicted acetyltransferase
MAELDIRVLAPSEHRAANALFRAALHVPAASDQQWEQVKDIYAASRTLGAFADGTLVGTAGSFQASLAVPGGATLPLAAVTRVGVRADHTRRGVLSGLMREQLDLAVRQGDVLAGLHASEAVIYGRFGYGVATRARAVRVIVPDARFRPEVPTEGEVRMLDPDAALETLTPLYERLGPYRPGTMTRTRDWWRFFVERAMLSGEQIVVAVHSGVDGDDGYVIYRAKQLESLEHPAARVQLNVVDFHAATPTAVNALWRFLVTVDLVDEVRADICPTDGAVEEMLVDRRACRTGSVRDELWLRLLDVPAALAARGYDDVAPVVIEVVDPLLPANSGRYRIGPQGATPTSERAQLSMGVDALAAIYLGATRPSILAGVGRIGVADTQSLTRADRLFGTGATALCGTGF